MTQEIQKEDSAAYFDDKMAIAYDRRMEGWASMRDSMLLFLQAALASAELPENARVLCVGVGTGTELIHLANRYPGWRFVAVEPAPAMMGMCRRKVREAGLDDRCEFHDGYLSSLPGQAEPFDAATCLLVSHFLMDRSKRTSFFQEILGRLKPGGCLVHSDLTGDMQQEEYWRLRPMWVQMLISAGLQSEELDGYVAAHGKQVDLLSPAQTREMLAAAGFEKVTSIYQCLLIHGWMSWRG